MDKTVKRFEITTRDGLVLRGEAFGDRTTPATPVICLPGLTRSSRDFHPLAERLALDPDHPRFVLALNSRGRGTSDHDPNPENYDLITEAQDVIDTLTAAGLHEAIFIGTSRGGLLTFVIAAMRPGLIAGALLNDIGPVIDAMGLSRIKTYLTRARPLTSWKDALDFAKVAHHGQFTNLTEAQWQQFVEMTFRDEDGVPVADFDKAIISGLESVDLSQHLPDAWPQFEALAHCPVMVLRGEHSDILSHETAMEMTRRHPDCQYREVRHQGHAPLFITDELNDTVADFLVEVDIKREKRQPHTEPAWLAEEDIVYLEEPARPEDTKEAISSAQTKDIPDATPAPI